MRAALQPGRRSAQQRCVGPAMLAAVTDGSHLALDRGITGQFNLAGRRRGRCLAKAGLGQKTGWHQPGRRTTIGP